MMNKPERMFDCVSMSELERRWQLLRAHMRERGLDVLISQGTTDSLSGHVRWITGFESFGYMKVALFFADGPMTTVEHGALGGRRTLNGDDPTHPGIAEIISTSAISSIHYTGQYEAQLVVEELRRRGCRRVGLVARSAMPYGFASGVIEGLRGAVEFSDETDAIDLLKAVKSTEEIEELRRTCAMQDAAFARVVAEVRPGMRDIDVTALAERVCRASGSDAGVLLAQSASPGRPAALGGFRFQARTVAAGDQVSMLVELNGAGGYYGELGRVLVLGRASNALREGFEIVREAQAHSVSLMRVGALCSDIARAHDEFMARHALPPELRLYSHGQGYDLVERPLVRSDEPMRLAANMFLSCHPSIFSPSLFAFLCDNFLVQEHGLPERMHRTAQQVFEVS